MHSEQEYIQLYMHIIIINSITMQTDLLAKLRKKEESLSGRLSKLEKTL